MTQAMLARLAGVSVATVSKAFSGSDEISPQTRERIFAIAREHGCFDQYNKNKFTKKVIAVICPELNSDYYNTLITILNREITKQSGIMTVSVNNFDPKTEQELFSYYSSYCKADGILLVTPQSTIRNTMRIPSVAMISNHSHLHVDSIALKTEEAVGEALGYLKQLGHRDIGFVGEPLTHSKKDLFCRQMKALSLPLSPDRIQISSRRFEQAGVDAVNAWVASDSLPTAVFTAYDYIAIGVIRQLRELRLRVPEDVSVVGMDDISIAPYLETSLSTIGIPAEEICRCAVALLMEKIENQYFSARKELVFSSLFIPRGSIGAPKGTDQP